MTTPKLPRGYRWVRVGEWLKPDDNLRGVGWWLYEPGQMCDEAYMWARRSAPKKKGRK